MHRCGLIFAVIVVMSTGASGVLVDNFDSYDLGQVDDVTTTWVGTDDVTIETDPDDPQNQVIAMWQNTGTQKAVYGILSSAASIPEGQTKTLFLRFRATEQIDSAWGMTDVDSPDVGGNNWGEFGPQVSVLNTDFRVRDSGSWNVAQPSTPEHWYNLWMVVHNASDSMQVYLHDRPEQAATEADRVLVGNDGDFGFRNAISGTIDRFYWRAQNTGGERRLWIDDVYVTNGVSLANPLKTGQASNPSPRDEQTDVLLDTVLSWAPGDYAFAHDVYFGTVADDVNNASRTNPGEVFLSQDQDANSYTPLAPLELGQTYYWRIDEVNAPSSPGIHKGTLWSFTTEAWTSPVETIAVTASTTSEAGKEPNNTVNGSGLTEGYHSIEELDMWVGDAAEDEPVWIQFDFDRLYKLQDMHVWNYNMEYEFIVGLGPKDVTIEYAVEANEWITLGDVELARASGAPTYAGETIDLGGIAAQAVRINIHNNRSTMSPLKFGLSEIQFNYIPAHAREPEPADGAADVSVDAVLGWRPGREAVTHQVNLGTDPNAVTNDEAFVDVAPTNAYEPVGLELETTYYWRIDEINDAATPAVWKSDLWSFATQQYITVDDFESYTGEENNRVYEAWADGYNIGSNGSVVGHDDPPYVEETTVRSGSQSMPFYYGVEGATTSEAELSLGRVEDWTQAGGAQTLVLFVRGSLGNATGQLYFKVNDTRVDFPGSAGSLAAPIWKQWNIDLASLGNAARSVSKLTIGVSGSGTGLLYVDDIRLYRLVEPMVGPPVDPGTTNLAAYYPMSNNANDASGNGLDGTAEVGSSFAQGPTGSGQAILLDGTSGYVDLPIGTLIQSLNSTTIATWLNWTGSGSWQRAFDFGSDTDVYMFLTPNSGGGTLRFAITTGSGGDESVVESSPGLSAGWHHVAVTIDGATGAMSLYLDGVLVDSETTETLPADLGNTTQNWLGRSQYAADAYFNGYIDEFRIYDRALSEAEVRYLVGDR